MSLPGNRASTTAVVSALIAPDDNLRLDQLVDYELGGVAFEDPSQGLLVRQWRAYVAGDNVCIAPYPEGTPVTTLFSASGITELSLAFDQSMHATIAYVQAGVTKLYWFDTVPGAQVTTEFPGATSPMLCLDDKRPFQLIGGAADVLLFYVREGGLYYRQQRDRFGVERLLSTLPQGVTSIKSVGMGENNRVQVQLSATPAVHVDLETDKLYVVNEVGNVLALHDGAQMTGTWRSRVFSAHDQSSFAWARVEAATYPCTLTLQGDGRVLATVPVNNSGPVRMPAIRSRELQIQVRSTGRVIAVYLGSTPDELS